MEHRVKIRETDVGRAIQAQAEDLSRLLQAYRSGAFSESHTE
jgi:fructose-1,6-bisphosphatase